MEKSFSGGWGVCALHPNKEKYAEQHLFNQGLECYFPFFLKPGFVRGKPITKPTPLFPGYGFVKLHDNPAFVRNINGTRGVKYLLSQNNAPQWVPDQFMHQLFTMRNANGLIEFGHGLKTGDQVKLLSGPFIGQIAQLQSLDKSGRVKLLLQAMNRSVQINTTLKHAIKVDG